MRTHIAASSKSTGSYRKKYSAIEKRELQIRQTFMTMVERDWRKLSRIKQHELQKDQKLAKADEYNNLSMVCNIPNAENETLFYQNIKKASQLAMGIEKRQDKLVAERDEFKVEGKKSKISN